MENPRTHNKATSLILDSIHEWTVSQQQGVGLSLAAYISQQLERNDFLKDDALHVGEN